MYMHELPRASQMVLVVKNPPASAGDIRHAGSVPGSGRSPGGGMAIHSNTFAWRIPWTEEPHGLQSIWSQRVRHDRRPLAHVICPGGSLVRNNRQCRRQRGCGLTAGSGRSPDVGNGNLLQYSCLENPMDRGAWKAMVLRVAKSGTQLND